MTNRGEKKWEKQTHNNAAQEERERIMRDNKTGRSCRLPGSSKVAADVLLILEWVGSKEKKATEPRNTDAATATRAAGQKVDREKMHLTTDTVNAFQRQFFLPPSPSMPIFRFIHPWKSFYFSSIFLSCLFCTFI